jgi:hypothetical protein
MDDFSTNGFIKAPIRAFDEAKAAVYLQKLREYESAVGEIKGVYRFQTHLLLPWVAEVSLMRLPDMPHGHERTFVAMYLFGRHLPSDLY